MACKGMKSEKQKYKELMDFTAAIARQCAPQYVMRIAETKEDAERLGVRVGDSYRELIPQKYVPFSQ